MFKRIYYDSRSKKIHLWETYNGKVSKLEEPFEYQYYIKDGSGTSNIKNIHGVPVVKQTTNDKKTFERLKQSGLELYESDIEEEVSFLQNRYGNVDLKPDIKDFNIAFLDIEIESENEFPKPEEAKFPINLITVISSKTGETHTWGNREYTGDSDLVKNFYYIPDETRMLEHFVSWWRKQKFDIVTGWWVKDFDIQYILNRLKQLDINKCISPLNKYYHAIKEGKFGKKVYNCKLAGLSILDYLELYKKFTFNTLDSYTLNSVSNYEGLGGKLELEGHINDAFKKNWNRFVEYNVMDVILVQKMEKKKKFIELAIQFSSEALIPVERVFSSIATVEGYIMRLMHKNNIVMSDRKSNVIDVWKKNKMYITDTEKQNVLEEQNSFQDFFVKGGHVEATPGLYNDVMSFDVESLYPHNIMMYNISPEVKVFNPSPERIAKGDLIKSPINGVYYLKNKKGIIPIAIEKIFNERKFYKGKMFEAYNSKDNTMGDFYDSQQQIRKILINSFYGAIANKYCHFFDVDNARVITRAGRVVIRYLSNCTNTYFKKHWHQIAPKHFPNLTEYKPIEENLVKVIDTDSNYVCMYEIKKNYAPDMSLLDFAYKMEKEVFNPFYDRILKIWADKHNAPQKINFKREGIIKKQFVLAKKKYITQLLQNEDKVYTYPKIKATGVEIVKSDTPKFCRDNIKAIVEKMFEGENPNKTEIMKELRQIKKEFKKQKIEDVSFNKSVNEYTKYAKPMEHYIKHGGLYFKSGTPMHTRASMCYNYIVERGNLPYYRVNNLTKIKYCFVDTKNILGTNVIGYIGNYPEEFHKKFNIDYNTQFEKSFLMVIQRMFDVLEWGEINFKNGGLSRFSVKRENK